MHASYKMYTYKTRTSYGQGSGAAGLCRHAVNYILNFEHTQLYSHSNIPPHHPDSISWHIRDGGWLARLGGRMARLGGWAAQLGAWVDKLAKRLGG
jgi:hypothetical protein